MRRMQSLVEAVVADWCLKFIARDLA